MATPDEKLLGKYLNVTWQPADQIAPAGMLTLTVYSRAFSLKQATTEIDVTVREDVLLGTTDRLAGVPDRDVTMGGLDSEVDAPDWDLVELGEIGTLTWYRRGTGTGMPKKSMIAVCTSNTFNSPHDNANEWELNFKGKSAITTAVVA